ncbi:uncharacterized protein [Aegilops tauschii subsp. strangulata]|uniref:uncharacterized protein isoform X2 n=1 Tax=Aegilops tauschii subsp. strangulata TaxID=200361 RepID=UPI003CC83C01
MFQYLGLAVFAKGARSNPAAQQHGTTRPPSLFLFGSPHSPISQSQSPPKTLASALHGAATGADLRPKPPPRSLRPHHGVPPARLHRPPHLRRARLPPRPRPPLDYRSSEFVVWDPVTGRERRIPDDVPDRYTNHVVLCAAGAGCDHSACSGGPFLMASAGVHVMDLVQADARLYSSETGVRRGPDGIYLDYNDGQFDEDCSYSLEADRPGVLVGGTLYFVCQSGALLRYGFLGKQNLSLIKPPPGKFHGRGTIVTRAENGGLGLATLGRDVLHLWSTETGPNGDVKWVKMNDIHLQKLMPFKSPARLIGSTEDTNVVFVTSDDHGIFTIELKSLLTRKLVLEARCQHLWVLSDLRQTI